MLSTWMATAALVAFIMLLACHGQLQKRPRLIVVLTALTFTAAGVAMLAISLEFFQAGKAWWFGHSRVPATRTGTPLFFWISTVILTAAGAAVGGLGIYLSGLLSMRRRRAPARNPFGPVMRAYVELPDRLLANPGAINPNFRGSDFGTRGKRVELLALARRLASTPPVFSKAIFAAALDFYNKFPEYALADGITAEVLAEIAGELFTLEERQRSDPPARADYHYRMLILYGLRESAWREQVLLALVENAARMDDAILAVQTMRFVTDHAAPSSAARVLAIGNLSQFLKTCVEPPATSDGNSWPHIYVVLDCTEVQDDELSRLARTAFWERADSCRARGDHQQFLALMKVGMLRGQDDFAQRAMAEYCSEFPKLLSASLDAATRAVTSLYINAGGRRAVLVAACLERVVPQLAAADVDAPARAWRGRTRDEWWM